MSAVAETLRRHAEEQGGQTALLVNQGGSFVGRTWADLDAATSQRADELAALMSADLPGCVAVELVRHDLPEIENLLAALRVDAPVLVVSGRHAPVRDAIAADVQQLGWSVRWAHDLTHAVADASVTQRRRAAIDAGCLLLASGGSTGRPKLVVDRVTRSLAERPPVLRPFVAMGWNHGRQNLVASPLYHAAGLVPFLESVVAGCASTVFSRFDARRVGAAVDDLGLDWLQVTPFHMSLMLGSDVPPDRWRRRPRVVHMSERCPDKVKRAFHTALGPDHVYELYTASEGIGTTMARGDEWDKRPGTVGRGFCTALMIGDADGHPLPPGTEGEVFMRSGGRRGGTYLSATGRLRVTPDGYATLGDVGHLDAERYLFLRPRQLATIAVAGTTVVPTEVEAELMSHPDVLDVGVCAERSATFGERVVAVVVTGSQVVDERSLRRWAQTRLAPAAVPARFLAAVALPREDTGKLNRRQLQDWVDANVGHEEGSS